MTIFASHRLLNRFSFTAKDQDYNDFVLPCEALFYVALSTNGTSTNRQPHIAFFAAFFPVPDYPKKQLVEVSGIEPLTSCMPCKRSPS
jgi:hypothetical protein